MTGLFISLGMIIILCAYLIISILLDYKSYDKDIHINIRFYTRVTKSMRLETICILQTWKYKKYLFWHSNVKKYHNYARIATKNPKDDYKNKVAREVSFGRVLKHFKGTDKIKIRKQFNKMKFDGWI